MYKKEGVRNRVFQKNPVSGGRVVDFWEWGIGQGELLCRTGILPVIHADFVTKLTCSPIRARLINRANKRNQQNFWGPLFFWGQWALYYSSEVLKKYLQKSLVAGYWGLIPKVLPSWRVEENDVASATLRVSCRVAKRPQTG